LTSLGQDEDMITAFVVVAWAAGMAFVMALCRAAGRPAPSH
jgi:hypothetical protein